MTALLKRVQRLDWTWLGCGVRAALRLVPFPPTEENLVYWATHIRAELVIFEVLLLIQGADQPSILTKPAFVAEMLNAEFDLICGVADQPTFLIDTADADCPAIHLARGLIEAALTGMSREMHNE